MKIEKREYKVYSFDELSKNAKQFAINSASEINLSIDWYNDVDIEEIAKKYGIEVDVHQISFDLDRENYVAFETYNHSQIDDYHSGICISDYKKFIKKAGLKISKELKENEFYIDHTHHAGGIIYNVIRGDDNLSERETVALQDCLDSFTLDVKKQLKETYDTLTGEEAIIESIKANEIEFLEDGRQFTL